MRRAMRVQKRQAVCPNVTVYGWESDLLVLNRRGTVEEYEVKTSRADWLAELRAMQGNDGKQPPIRRPGSKAWRAAKLAGGWDDRMAAPPNYFWLACPPDVIAVAEVPDFAGLIVLHGMGLGATETLRRAPRLHDRSVSDRVREYVERGMALRLTDMRWAACRYNTYGEHRANP